MNWSFSRSVFMTAVFACLLSTSGNARCQQMEMRNAEEFGAAQFALSKPAVGEKAPALELQTLDGDTVKLSSYRGKTVVVIKAGYT